MVGKARNAFGVWRWLLYRLLVARLFERAFWLANVKYKDLQVGEIISQLLFATCLLAVPWLGSRACVARSFGRLCRATCHFEPFA